MLTIYKLCTRTTSIDSFLSCVLLLCNCPWTFVVCLSFAQLSTATQQLQLLYSDQTEEVVAGQDFCDLLRNGHLALAAGQAPPPNGASECRLAAKGILRSPCPPAAKGVHKCCNSARGGKSCHAVLLLWMLLLHGRTLLSFKPHQSVPQHMPSLPHLTVASLSYVNTLCACPWHDLPACLQLVTSSTPTPTTQQQQQQHAALPCCQRLVAWQPCACQEVPTWQQQQQAVLQLVAWPGVSRAAICLQALQAAAAWLPRRTLLAARV